MKRMAKITQNTINSTKTVIAGRIFGAGQPQSTCSDF